MTPVLLGMGLSSAAAFLAYGLDKRRAVRGERRIPESSLHLLELAGGWPGALVAARLFHHKTRKPSYRVVRGLIVLLHLAAWTWFLWPR